MPTVPSTVTAGDTLAFPVTRLDLTSLGSPLNTSLDVRLDGVSIGTAPVSGGNAAVSVTIPADTDAGAHTLTLVASPSNTTVTLPAHRRGGRPVVDDHADGRAVEPGVRLVVTGPAHGDGHGRRARGGLGGVRRRGHGARHGGAA